MRRRKHRRAAGLILIIWTLVLLWLTVLGRPSGERGCFLIPFQSTVGMFSFSPWYETLYLLVGNIVWFIPIGLLLPAASRLNPWLAVAGGAGLSMLIEGSQYLFSVGVTDIDDLILNTLGSLIGVLFYYVIKKKLPHLF